MNKQTDQLSHQGLLSKIHSCIKRFFINFLSTHRIWLVRSQRVTSTPTATFLSYFAKEQSSRNVSIELLFLFCSQPHHWPTNIWWTRRASRKLPSLFHPLRKQSYWSQMIPCYHFGNNTDDIMFSQWISLSKRIDPKLTDDQKEELSDIIIKDPSTSLDHIH